jgi:hypothetical protein
MPERKFKPRTRKTALRDASLIIIATEGEKTEKIYLDALHEAYRNLKVHVVVLERKKTASSPQHVLENMNEFRKQYSLEADDQLWLVVDVDAWTEQMLGEVATECRQKAYKLAVSNPCFELWLLLHRKSLDEYTPEAIEELAQNKKVTKGRNRLEAELLNLCGRYDKADYDVSDYIPFVEQALERAKAIDTNPEHRWPQKIGTRVYLLAESIIKKPER